MPKHTITYKEPWQIGQEVKAGFVTVIVRAALLDSVYLVSSTAGTQLYKFVPHGGLHKITPAQAKDLLAQDQNRHAAMRDAMSRLDKEREEVNSVFA